MSTLSNYLFKKLVIKVKMVVPYHHQSQQAEHGIKPLTTILIKHLTRLGQYWQKYLPFAIYSYNSFCSPSLNCLSPFELVLSRKPLKLIDFETDPNVKLSGM